MPDLQKIDNHTFTQLNRIEPCDIDTKSVRTCNRGCYRYPGIVLHMKLYDFPGVVKFLIRFVAVIVTKRIFVMEEQENYLQIEVISQDQDMFELEITVSNGHFTGVTQIYDYSESIINLAKSLEGYPQSRQSIFYESGSKSSYLYASIKFCQLVTFGLVGVQVCLKVPGLRAAISTVDTELFTELVVEPNAIDIFQKYLVTLASKKEGIAKLMAR